MAKRMYWGVDDRPRKAKKLYLGVFDNDKKRNVPRKIKKVYWGVGDVPRPCWSGGLEYYGTVTPLSEGRSGLAAASTQNRAYFACGRLSAGTSISYFSKTIDVYNRDLTRTSLSLSDMVVSGTDTSTSLNPREFLSGGAVNDTAIFAGGQRGTSYHNDVFAVTMSTVSRVPSGQYMQHNAASHATTAIGDRVIFANGIGADKAYYRTVEAYDTSLTKTTCSTTSKTEAYRAATTVGNYAIIAGGEYGNAGATYDATIDVYDSSLTKITAGIALSSGRSHLSATTINDYALFAGGTINANRQNVVDCYNASLTHSTTVAPLSEARMNIAAVTTKDIALFLGGEVTGNPYYSSTVDAYDGGLIKVEVPQLTESRHNHAAATVGDFVLVGGGSTANEDYASSVEAYVYF